MNRKYELVYVVSPVATDEQVSELHTQIESVVQRMGGRVEKTENWGRRKLAYEIGHQKEGTYVLEVITGSGDLMKEIDRRLKVIDYVIRHLIVRVDEDEQVVERQRSKRTDVSRRRRVAGAGVREFRHVSRLRGTGQGLQGRGERSGGGKTWNVSCQV